MAIDCQATYSPEDNKLRLYPVGQLPPEVRDRLYAAGFRWARAQELYVAPGWTPERADLLTELAGSIDDEDRSLVDRADDRAERFDGYEESRRQDSESAGKRAHQILDVIPPGQPILVGHHSERRHRAALRRADNAQRVSVVNWKKAEYWQQRAAAARRHARYKLRPGVRARRIKGLEADERRQVRALKHSEGWLMRWTRADDVDFWRGKVATLTVAERLQLLAKHDPAIRWSEEAERTALRQKAMEAHQRHCEQAVRWLEHTRMRLAYERAMLQADGGLPSDRILPEVGGGCRCWASPREGWSFIQRVNKVSVTVLDNWGNGGPCFRRNIPFDKLAAIMAAAEVQKMRDAGRLRETEDGAGFYVMPERAEGVR